jgi:hypothetical protein
MRAVSIGARADRRHDDGPTRRPLREDELMAKYLVLIYETERGPEEPMTPELRAEYDKHWTFIERRRPIILAGEALQPTATATSLVRDGSGAYAVTDGPFLETKETLGGFYLLEAPHLDAAIDLAREIPAPRGGLEIRPILELAR